MRHSDIYYMCMVNYLLKSGIIVLLSSLPALADPVTQFNPSQSTKILGSEFGANLYGGAPTGTQQTNTATTLTALGQTLQALSATVTAPTAPTGETYTEFYSFGSRIFDQQTYFTNNGLLQATAGISPTEITVPIVDYPIGPLSIQVSGGVRFEGDISGQLAPTIGIPLSFSALGVNLKADASGSGFIEGDASLIFIRAGVGGQVDLIDGEANVQSVFFFDGRTDLVEVSGYADFLKGNLYGFADVFNIFGWSWSRFLNIDLFNWNGVCVTAGGATCPAS